MSNGDVGMWLFLAFMAILFLPILLTEAVTHLTWRRVDENPHSAICKTDEPETEIIED